MLSLRPVPGVRRCGVLGHPIDHSLSPLLHRTAYEQLALLWTYDAHDVTEQGLPEFLQGLDGSWRGLSLTMPLKRAVLPLLDDLDHTARAVGAANTVLLEAEGRYGANTDVPGLVAALREAGCPAGSGSGAAVVVGGGATAASALAALAELGIEEAQLRVRDVARAGETVATGHRLGLTVRTVALRDAWPAHPDPAIVVSTVPSTVAAQVLPDQVLAGAVVVDARYDSWPSALLQRAEPMAAGLVTGVDLLVHQAVGQVLLMTGRAVDVEPLRRTALAAVAERVHPRGQPAGP